MAEWPFFLDQLGKNRYRRHQETRTARSPPTTLSPVVINSAVIKTPTLSTPDSFEGPTQSYSSYNLSFSVSVADRFEISNRAAAEFRNGLLRDLGFSRDDIVLTESSFRKKRDKQRSELESLHQQNVEHNALQVMGFDGKVDKTKLIGGREGKEEHITILGFPGDKYLSHFAPYSKKAIDISQGLLDVIQYSNSA